MSKFILVYFLPVLVNFLSEETASVLYIFLIAWILLIVAPCIVLTFEHLTLSFVHCAFTDKCRALIRLIFIVSLEMQIYILLQGIFSLFYLASIDEYPR